MGLCKCPKRQVTNQFCFEHRVNVCEHCMVASHQKVSELLFFFLFMQKDESFFFFFFSALFNHIFSGLKIVIIIQIVLYVAIHSKMRIVLDLFVFVSIYYLLTYLNKFADVINLIFFYF